MKRWVEYYEQLLTMEGGGLEVEDESAIKEDDLNEIPTREEVAETIRRLTNNRALGED